MADDNQRTEPTVPIRNAILEGELAPGQRLVEADLSHRFNSTRGAVRQSLIQLEGEGLVEREHNRGARVRAIDLHEAIEITEARAVLEGLCAAKAAINATTDELRGLRALARSMQLAVEDGDVVGYSSLCQAIHTDVRRLAHHGTLTSLLERLRYQSVRYHFGIALMPGRPKAGLEEHLEIIDAITSRSPDAAEGAMRNHLGIVVDALRKISEQPGGRLPLVVPSSSPGDF